MESGKPTISAGLWTSTLSGFLNICYKKNFDVNLIPKITKLIGQIFFGAWFSFGRKPNQCIPMK